MNGSAAIDTNVIIRAINADISGVSLLDGIDGVFVPVIVVGELFFGARNSARRQENFELFRRTVASFDGILPIDEAVAESYSFIKFDLKRNGFTLPENDLWIAAVAHANGLPLATFDGHFKHISCVKIIP